MDNQASISQEKPYAVQVTAGKEYYWCTCGRSKTQPFCDGAHNGTGLVPQTFKALKSETVYFCGCKKTATPPLCDGNHQKL